MKPALDVHGAKFGETPRLFRKVMESAFHFRNCLSSRAQALPPGAYAGKKDVHIRNCGKSDWKSLSLRL